MEPSKDIHRLIEILVRLRDPVSGCPWDLQQDFASIAPYTIEEAYEVADAIQRGDMDDLLEELGDLLLQPVYHAQLAQEAGYFSFGDVVFHITQKLIRRHPHVFAGKNSENAELVKKSWEHIKAEEKKHKSGSKGLLHDVPLALPALAQAQKLQGKAAQAGFDWPDYRPVLQKAEEEWTELLELLPEDGGGQKREAKADNARLCEEMGDVLFSIVNLCRHLNIDAEQALRSANGKFMRRFAHMEEALCSEGKNVHETSPEALEELWRKAKAAE